VPPPTAAPTSGPSAQPTGARIERQVAGGHAAGGGPTGRPVRREPGQRIETFLSLGEVRVSSVLDDLAADQGKQGATNIAGGFEYVPSIVSMSDSTPGSAHDAAGLPAECCRRGAG